MLRSFIGGSRVRAADVRIGARYLSTQEARIALFRKRPHAFLLVLRIEE
jgi:hypothetical protein